jgi:hypothetical protein
LENKQHLSDHAKVVANKIFGKSRWDAIVKDCKGATDEREHLMQMCFSVLHSSGWDDNPDDRNRTLANMEQSTICYVDERLPTMDLWPLYVEDERNPACMVGIEQAFDIVLEYDDGTLIRYIGTVDGLVKKVSVDKWFLDENKTASRITDGWRLSFDMAHQVTAYCAASTTVFGFPVFNARVTGNLIKPTGKGEDVYPIEVSRDEYAIRNWASWVYHTVRMFDAYKDDFELAPRYTHSCNRYFRPCSLLPFCCDTPEGRLEQFNEMVPVEPTPSERAIEALS